MFSSSHWGYALSNPDKAYTADCPTLHHIDAMYGESMSAKWVHAQVLALFGASSCKDEEIAKGISVFSKAFAGEVRNFKISEIMLFFARYQAGKYDDSYASFDLKRIGSAFWTKFLKERNYELDRIQRELNKEESDRNRFTPPEGYTSWSWYQELKLRAEKGDKDAQNLLESQKKC